MLTKEDVYNCQCQYLLQIMPIMSKTKIIPNIFCVFLQKHCGLKISQVLFHFKVIIIDYDVVFIFLLEVVLLGNEENKHVT